MSVAVDIHTLSTCEQRALLESLQALVPDQSYRETAMGGDVVDYLAYKEWRGLTEQTRLAREGQLGVFAKAHADLPVSAFTGRDGARLVEAFLIRAWMTDKHGKPLAQGTRANRTITLRDFFKWAYRDGRVDHDPMEFVDTPKRGGKRRDAHPRAEVIRLITAQPRWRDRLALALMARQALRKNELRLLQLGHLDFQHRHVAIFGKGSKYAVLPLFDDLAEDLERYVQERALENERGYRTEYLLHRIHASRSGTWPTYQPLERHDRAKPLTSSGMQHWWERCLERATIDRFPMHELRHTAGTDFHHGPARGDYGLTQQFMRHSNVAVTAGYIHKADESLVQAMRAGPRFWEETHE